MPNFATLKIGLAVLSVCWKSHKACGSGNTVLNFRYFYENYRMKLIVEIKIGNSVLCGGDGTLVPRTTPLSQGKLSVVDSN